MTAFIPLPSLNTGSAHSQAAPEPPPELAWQMITDQMRFQMDKKAFDAYIRDTRVLGFNAEVLQIASPSAYARDWAASRLSSTVQGLISPLFGRPVKVRFLFLEGPETLPETQNAPSAPPHQYEPPRQPDRAAQPAAPPLVGDPQIAKSASPSAYPSEQEKNSTFRIARESQVQNHIGLIPDTAPFVQESVHRQVNSGREEPLEWGNEAVEDEPCQVVMLESVASTIEAALQQPGKIVAFPRYELRHIPMVGPEAFFLRLAFLQERFLNTHSDGRGRPFETTVESLLRWANVGRATLHRFKKGDLSRGQQPSAGWFGIEQLPSAPRSGNSQQQPPCRYRIQQGIPLTPMDADRLQELLIEAGIRSDPLTALQSVCSRPIQDLLVYPPPAPSEAQKKRAPVFTTVTSVVQAALEGQRIEPDLRPRIQEWTGRLADHVTLPQQMVFVSWYFLQHWLPILGHDAAALVLAARAQGYYNPQEQELREEFWVHGGYRELAQGIGLKRDRTIGDWLPNLFDRQEKAAGGPAESEKWQREQARQQQIQAHIAQFIQVTPGSRKKMAEGYYSFKLHVEIQGEPLTHNDQGLRAWVHQTLATCAEEDVLRHFQAWVTSPVIALRAQNDGRGTLGNEGWDEDLQNDGWGIQVVREQTREMTGGESALLDSDGWGILEDLLNDGRGILANFEMTAGELFKGLLRLNTYWESILQELTSTVSDEKTKSGVVSDWDFRSICQRSGGMNRFREGIQAKETGAQPLFSWILYAYSFKGRGIADPVGWALNRLREQPGVQADGAFAALAALPPDEFRRLLRRHIESGLPPANEHWRFAFREITLVKLKELADLIGEGENA